jgi:hypothetical protein
MLPCAGLTVCGELSGVLGGTVPADGNAENSESSPNC